MLRLRAQGLRHACRLVASGGVQPVQSSSSATCNSTAGLWQHRAFARNDGSAIVSSPLDAVGLRMTDERRESAAAAPSDISTGQQEQSRPDAGVPDEGGSSAARATCDMRATGPPATSAAAAAPATPAAAASSKPEATHWLDRHFPAARGWLQEQNRQWWIRGIQARCKQFPQLSGREELLQRLISEKYRELIEKHQDRIVDGRAETHLQMAALLLASYRVLSPWVRDDKELLQLLKEHMGGQASPALRFMLRGTLMLSRSPFAWQSARLRALQLDAGSGSESELQRGESEAELTIKRCFYHDLLLAEGVPELAQATCCSVDRIWFEDLEYHGVAFEQPSCLSRGDSCCQLQVRKL